MYRKPAFAGSFYPAAPEALRREVEACLGPERESRRAAAILAPHAGYIYSGPCAGRTYSKVHIPGLVVLLGPNHSGLGAPLAIVDEGEWETPLGRVRIDATLGRRLRELNADLSEDALAHARLDGLRGLEIGAAAHNPFGLDTRNVAVPADWEFYANSQRDLGVEPARVNIWATADNIPVGNASQDFVITSHVVEHLPDLIGALVEWDRVVRDGGYIYMIVPLKGALAEDGPRPLTPVEHFVDDWRASAHTRSPRVRRAWRHVTSVDGALLARAHRSALSGALAKVVRSRLVHGRLGFATALARREPWDRHPTEGVPGGRGGHYHTFVPDTILSLVAWMRTEGLCDWTLTSREEVDGKVGNGFTLAFRVRVPRGCAGT